MNFSIFHQQRHRADVTQNTATSPMLQRWLLFASIILVPVRHLFLCILLFSFSLFGLCQTKSLTLYQNDSNKTDTSLYLTIQKNNKDISFVFPAGEPHPYYTLRSDSTWEEHPIPPDTPVFGPYKFKKAAEKILFQDKNVSSKYRDLYELSDKEYLSPDLFSSSTDSYTILTRLLDADALVSVGGSKVKCYKFSQLTTDHYSNYKYHRILYVDKVNLIPCRIEFYADKDCTILQTTVFIKEYVTL